MVVAVMSSSSSIQLKKRFLAIQVYYCIQLVCCISVFYCEVMDCFGGLEAIRRPVDMVNGFEAQVHGHQRFSEDLGRCLVAQTDIDILCSPGYWSCLQKLTVSRQLAFASLWLQAYEPTIGHCIKGESGHVGGFCMGSAQQCADSCRSSGRKGLPTGGG